MKKLEEHLVKGTFPTDISFKFSGYSQYPSSISLEEIKRLREEETTIVHEASLKLLTIRRNAILVDLENTESLARDMSKTSFFTNSVNEEFGPSFFPKTLIIHYTNEFESMVKKLKGLPPPTPVNDPTDAQADDNDDVIDIPNEDELNSSSSTRLVTFRTIDRQFSSRNTDSNPRQQTSNRVPEKNSRSHSKLAQELFNLLPELESMLKKKNNNEKDNNRRQKNESRRGRSTTRSRDASHEPKSKSRSSQRSPSSNSTKNNQSKKPSQDNNKKKKSNSNSNNRPRSRSNNRGRGQGSGSGNRKKY